MSLIKSISGIRGTIGGKSGISLSPVDVTKYTAAYAAWIRSHTDRKAIVLGRDARLSGEMITRIVSSTLQAMGLDVIDLGMATTPTVEMAVAMEKAAGGIIVTASHNPIHWNALKLLNSLGEFVSAEDGRKILDLAEEGDFEFSDVRELGAYRQETGFLDKHIDAILRLPLVDRKAIEARNFSIIVDGVNSAGGIAIPILLEALGVRHITLINCEPDGHFAHNPEPLPENLTQISSEIHHGKFDLGIVVDPDVDRLCFVNEDGSMFGEEYTLVAVADYVLKHKKGNTVSNLSSTQALRDVTHKAGGAYFASAVGEVNVVQAMKKHQAVIGGEGNGGVIYPDLHYGRDGLVGVALFLSHLAHFGKSISMLRATYPSYHISKNKIELTPDINVDLVIEEIREKYKKQPINDSDGVRIDFDKMWVHLRKSNTEPIIRIYAEADTEATADNMAAKIMEDIREIVSKNVYLPR